MRARPVIIDANSLIIRNVMASALSDLKADGTYTGGIYGSLNMLRSLLLMPEMDAGRIVAFFDCGVPARRLRLLPGYKGERKERRELLPEEEKEKAFAQIDRCWELFPLLGVTCLAYKDREADDGVAATARLWGDEAPAVITSDRDLYQTVLFGAEVWDLGAKCWVTADGFVDVTGVHPKHYILYRTLVGDKSDSVEGVPGCGEKRALGLINELEDEYPGVMGLREPTQQLDMLCGYIRTRGACRKYEEALLAAHLRLRRVIPGIDLRASFGPTQGLSAALEDAPALRPKDFLRACAALEMGSILGDPERYLTPFREAERRVSEATV